MVVDYKIIEAEIRQHEANSFANKTNLDKNKVTYFRLDGKKFKSLLDKSLFEKPYDKIILDAFQMTCQDLIQSEWPIDFIYQQSDELSLVMLPRKNKNGDTTNMLYNGNVTKHLALLASKVTSLFVVHIFTILELIARAVPGGDISTLVRYEKIKNHVKRLGVSFDNRVFQGAFYTHRAFMWRLWDNGRNSINTYATSVLGHGPVVGKTSAEARDLADSENQQTKYNDLDSRFRCGRLYAKDYGDDDWNTFNTIMEKHIAEENVVVSATSSEYEVNSD